MAKKILTVSPFKCPYTFCSAQIRTNSMTPMAKRPRPRKAFWHTSRMPFGSTWTTRAKGNPRVPSSLPPEWTGQSKTPQRIRMYKNPSDTTSLAQQRPTASTAGKGAHTARNRKLTVHYR